MSDLTSEQYRERSETKRGDALRKGASFSQVGGLIDALIDATLALSTPRPPIEIPAAWAIPQEEAARMHERLLRAQEQGPWAAPEPMRRSPEPEPKRAEQPTTEYPDLVVDHPYKPWAVDGVVSCRDCDRAHHDHVSELDSLHGNEVPVHVPVPRSVLAGMVHALERLERHPASTPDGPIWDNEARDALLWARANL